MPRHRKHERAESAGRPLWSGTLSFGLVSIPVDLYPGTRNAGVSLRMLGPDGTPLARRYYCPEHDTALDAEELVRGYEAERGRYVVVSDEELAALEPKKSREIDLQQFVEVSAIDPIYFSRSYLLAPAAESGKAYMLLTSIMQRSGRAGIGNFVMRDREYWVAILSDGVLLRAEVLRFADEVRSFAGVGLPKRTRPEHALVQAFDKWLDSKSDELELDALNDEHSEQLLRLVHEKERRGRDIVESAEPAADVEAQNDAEIIDLMDVLKRSLGKPDAKSEGKPARSEHATRGARKAR